MKLHYELRRDDYVKFVLARSDRRKPSPRHWLLLVVLLSLLIALSALLTLMYGDTSWIDAFSLLRPLFYAIAGALAMMLVSLGLLAILRTLVGRWPSPSSTPGTHTFELSSDGFSDDAPNGQILRKWSEIREVRETPQAIGFIVSPGQVHVVPKRAFQSNEQAASFAHEQRQKLLAHRSN